MLLGLAPLVSAWAQEKAAEPTIDSVALFKNGLTVVRASFSVEGPGDYVWIDPPKVVHGAFFVESGPGLVIRSTTRMMVPDGPVVPSGNLQRDLAGAVVSATLWGRDGQPGEVVDGTVWTVPEPEVIDWNTNYPAADGRNYGYFPSAGPSQGGAVAGTTWLVLETAGKRRFLATDRIAKIEVEREATARVREPRPVMIFSAKQAGPVQLIYLSKGMAWMPAYQIDLLADDRLRLRQTAVVRNELMDLDGTELELISGYPNIQFSHVDSPLSPEATLAAFFQQLSQGGGSSRGIASQQLVMSNSLSNVGFNVTVPVGSGETAAPAEDLHYESIGVHSLNEGDSLSVEVASAEASCERIVEWTVPDYRDDYGRLQRNRERKDEHEPWDAVQFVNPLSFPMTTAAASIMEKGRFQGQSMATWIAPGQEASIKINKALTVRGEHSEVEEEGQREVVWIAGNDYQRTVVSGRVKVSNARGEAVKMVIRTDFSGELIEAQGDPKTSLRADGARSVNPHRQLVWTLDLANWESKTLTYRYSLLVNR